MKRTLMLVACMAGIAATMVSNAAADEPEFKPLFDGKTLDGWIGAVDGYAVEDGAIVCLKEKGGNLYTKKEYGDFVLRFEFQMEPGGNNGVGLRAPLEGDAAYVGLECQVLDDEHESYAGIKPYQAHGSIYGVIPAERGRLKPAGEWNQEEIYLVGDDVRVTLNGHVILEGNLREASKDGTLDGNEHPGLKRRSGHIGFLGHGHRVAFRKIEIQEIEK